MTKLHNLVKSLITELVKSQAPNAFPEKIDGVTVMSGFVSAGDGGSLVLSRPMEKIIVQIGDVLKQNDPAFNRSHTDNEWTRLVRGAFGPPLAAIDLSCDQNENAETILVAVRKTLTEDTVGGVREYAFGCTLFYGNPVAPFNIGPVRIEARVDWLQRKVKEGDVTSVTARRLRKLWKGNKIGKRKAVIDNQRELNIVDAVGSCNYVCSVVTNGLASEAGKLKAQTAARLALTCVALWWETPSSALKGFNLLVDRSVRQQRTLFFIPGKITLGGSSLQGLPHGPSITPSDWKDILVQHRNEFDVVGELIEFYLSPTGKVSRPNLMNTLAQALLWFHEGCREQVDLMAIVKFAATLDALASGTESAGILKLIKARLGLEPNDQIRPNGQTVKQGVKEIYSKGRSRTIHGTNEKLQHDWTATRGFSEVLARYCLIMCLEWAGKNNTDDPKLLMQ